MKKVTVKLDTINDVKNFVNAVTAFECDFDIVSERYVELSKSLALHINSDDEKEINAVLKAISAVLVSE